jgi:hypothetical protein
VRDEKILWKQIRAIGYEDCPVSRKPSYPGRSNSILGAESILVSFYIIAVLSHTGDLLTSLIRLHSPQGGLEKPRSSNSFIIIKSVAP